jgi:hypothetical protein
MGRQIDQRIDLLAETRHFGGRQWYFVCTCATWLQFCGCHQVQTHLHLEQDGGRR